MAQNPPVCKSVALWPVVVAGVVVVLAVATTVIITRSSKETGWNGEMRWAEPPLDEI